MEHVIYSLVDLVFSIAVLAYVIYTSKYIRELKYQNELLSENYDMLASICQKLVEKTEKENEKEEI